MAEFSDVGAFCSICGQQDFLPQKCGDKVFCESCFRNRRHAILDEANGGMDEEQHDLYTTTEQPPKRLTDGGSSSSTSAPRLFCVACKQKLIPEKAVQCDICEQTTCFKHRYEDEHPCFEFFTDLTSKYGATKTAQKISDEQWDLLEKVFTNVVKKQDDKYRFLKRSNETLKRLIFTSIPMMRILTVLGFVADPSVGLTLPVKKVPRVARVFQQWKSRLSEFREKAEDTLLLASKSTLVASSSKETMRPQGGAVMPTGASAPSNGALVPRGSVGTTSSDATPENVRDDFLPPVRLKASAAEDSVSAAATATQVSQNRNERGSAVAAAITSNIAASSRAAPPPETTFQGPLAGRGPQHQQNQSTPAAVAGMQQPAGGSAAPAVKAGAKTMSEADKLAELRELRKQQYKQNRGVAQSSSSGSANPNSATSEEDSNCVCM